MKLFQCVMCMSVFIYCGCSDAAPKEKLIDLSCPYVLPAEKDLLPSWVALGAIPFEKLLLRQTGVILANAAEEKIRLAGVKDRVFAEDVIDEWDELKGRSEAVVEYSADNHDDHSLMCTYGRSYKESNDGDRNVVLLIPLPSKKTVNCLFVRRDIDPTVEASCKIK